MTVAALIELLSEMPQDAQVRIAIQPRYPLGSELEAIATAQGEEGQTVYLGATEARSYLDEEATDALKEEGWGSAW